MIQWDQPIQADTTTVKNDTVFLTQGLAMRDRVPYSIDRPVGQFTRTAGYVLPPLWGSRRQ